MDIKISTKQILNFLYILSWIVFVALCIEGGGIIFNSFFTQVINPIGAKYFWNKIDLSALYSFDSGYFLVITVLMSIVAVMKAILFYLIVKILHDKKLNLSKPFDKSLEKYIFKFSYLALGISIFSYWGIKNRAWTVNQGIQIPEMDKLGFGGADVWLFMAILLFIIAQIFKRGIELQEENDLTI